MRDTLTTVKVDAHPESRVHNSQPHGIGRVVALDGLFAWNNLGRNVVFAGEDFRPRAVFDESYEPVAPTRRGKPGRYRKRPRVVWAKPMHEPFVVQLDGNRGSLSGMPGDWLVQYAPDDWSVVSGPVFTNTYELLD